MVVCGFYSLLLCLIKTMIDCCACIQCTPPEAIIVCSMMMMGHDRLVPAHYKASFLRKTLASDSAARVRLNRISLEYSQYHK